MTRLLLLPAIWSPWNPDGSRYQIKVLIVDREVRGYGDAHLTIVLRESLPDDVTWRGSRLPGSIGDVDEEDVLVDLAEVEAEP